MSSVSPKYVYVRTFGCQMNEHDSGKMILILSQLGFNATDDITKADLIIYNTCTIREKAHHKASSEIGRTKLLKKRKPELLIAVCGCVAQQDKNAIFEDHPYVDIVFGPDAISKLPQFILEAKKKSKIIDCELVDEPGRYVFIGDTPKTEETRASAFVSIMKGCNLACAYCIVPSVRGREVYRPKEEILDEVRRLSAAGVKEVVLLGQNVNAYKGFSNLIREISDKTDIKRIRFTSPHPKDVGDDLIREYAENEKLCPHIHLPMQSGSTSVLKRMRRGYTRERYLDITSKLKEARAGMSITTDIIVGFCGETEDEFSDTVSLMEAVQFDSAFAFKYSPRPGTYAAEKLSDDVTPSEKEKRLEIVLDKQRETTTAKNRALVGSVHTALAYSRDKKTGVVTGRFPDNHIVHFLGNGVDIGCEVGVRVVKANKNSLAGEVLI